MKKMKLFLTGLMLVVSVAAFAQNIQVKGTVTDANNGEAIPFASVMLKGTMNGVSTDANGAYSITVPAHGTLVVSFVGYVTREVAIDGKPVVDVVLNPSSEFLEDVIVVAYGTAKKESFTGSASVVKKEELTKRAVSNVTKALDGLIAGVTTTSGSGQPGEGASIQIRGTGSINASSSPLYVVDGIPFDGSISSINPNDIESMSVLKDASAGALYGARGANGVVLITTKHGKDGVTNVNFKAQVGRMSRALPRYETVNQKEFVELSYEALYNYAVANGYSDANAKSYAASNLGGNLGGEFYNPYKNYTWETVIDPATGNLQSDAVSAWDEDWMDELTNADALRQEYQVGISGGNDKTQSALSFGYLQEDGVLITTNFRRFTGRANVDQKVTKWMNAGMSISYSNSISTYDDASDSQTSNPWYTAQFMAPIYPVYLKNADGTDALDENGERQYDYGNNPQGSRPKGAKFNAVGDLKEDINNVVNDNISYRSYLKLGGDDKSLGALQGLSLTINFGGDVISKRQSNYTSPYSGNGKDANGDLDKYSTRTSSFTLNQLLNYDRKFDKHHVALLAGHEYYNYEYNYLYSSKSGVYPGITELAPATNLVGGNSYSDYYKVESYLSRLNYDFADKYYLSASWRTDGSSRFYKDNRWGQFWSVGASWRVSQENFMKSVSWVDNLTVKASYGVQGNDSVGLYAWQAFYDLTWANAGNAGALLNSLENKEVSWEKKQGINVGIETSLFHNVLQATIEYYDQNTIDMLLYAPLPMSSGFSGVYKNVGSMNNKGFESSFTVNWLNSKNIKASSTLMLYNNKNKVTSLYEDQDITSGSQIIRVGLPVYSYYLPKFAGVDPATGNMLYYAFDKDDDGNMVEGSEYITSDKSKATNCKYVFESRAPKFQGSFGSNFYFGPVDFSFLTTFSYGGLTMGSLYEMEAMYVGDTWSKNILRRWQQPGDITDVPKVLFNSGRLTTDYMLIDASYFSIKSIQLGYTFPQALANKLSMKGLRVYALADNIAMFSHLKGMDPQASLSGGSGYTYAPTRNISVGLDINF